MTAFLVLVVLEAVFLVALVWAIAWVFAGGIAWILVKLLGLGLGIAQWLVLWTAAMFSGVERAGGTSRT